MVLKNAFFAYLTGNLISATLLIVLAHKKKKSFPNLLHLVLQVLLFLAFSKAPPQLPQFPLH